MMKTAIHIGSIALIVAGLTPLDAQAPRDSAADFTKAALAEVKNASGQVVLSGKFVVETDKDDDDEERKAKLAPTPVDADAEGEAEIEVSGTGSSRRQEVEFSLSNLQPGAVYTLVIDGKVFATVTANERGRAEHERYVPLP
jgi:hypothetical protein